MSVQDPWWCRLEWGWEKKDLGPGASSPHCCLTSVRDSMVSQNLEFTPGYQVVRKPYFFTVGRQSVFCLTVSELDLYLFNI